MTTNNIDNNIKPADNKELSIKKLSRKELEVEKELEGKNPVKIATIKEEDKKNDDTRRWLVAYIHVRHEKKVRENLTKMGIINFLPVQKVIRQWSDRKKIVEAIVLPMMIFVKVNKEEQSEVLTLASISRYVYERGHHEPAEIPEDQMKKFIFMLTNSEDLVEISDTNLTKGDDIIVTKGLLCGLEGEFLTVNGKTKVMIRLDTLGCATVEVPKEYIDKVKR